MPTSSRFAVAVHVLALCAREGGGPLKSEDVAESVNTNPVVIRRILCELARAGLVRSQPGSGGGSRLAREPRDINLFDVYRAVEGGGVFSMPRRQPSRDCGVGRNIDLVLGDVLDLVNTAVGQTLAGVTVEDVMLRLRSCRRGRRRVRG